MAQQATLASSATAYDRIAADPITLSDGTAVILYATSVWGTTPQTLFLAYSSDRVTWTSIATIITGATSSSFGTPSYSATSAPRSFALARDASDNIFVIGTIGSSSSTAAVQAFSKSGSTWTQQSLLTASTSAASGLQGKAVVWCDTGGGTGGAGHLLVHYSSGNASASQYLVLDAGAALAGSGTVQVSGGASTAGVSNFGPHLSADGFGASSGLLANPVNSSAAVSVAYWSVDSSGTRTSTALTSMSTVSFNASGRVRLMRHASGAWAILAPSATAGQYAVARYSSTAQTTATTTAANPANIEAASSANHNWDWYLDQSVPSRAWITTVSTSGLVYRFSVDLSSGVTFGSTATLEDTLSPFSNPSSGLIDLRFSPYPLAGSKADYLVNAATSSATTYALLVDYISFTPPIPDSVGVLIG